MAIRDQENLFSDAQALTATAISTNVIDLVNAQNLTRDIGAGEVLWVVVTVTTTLDSSGEAATLVVALESDDNTSLTTATVHYTSASIAEASLVAGYELKFRVPPGDYQRYVGLRYTVGTENFTSGNISAALQRDAELRKDYASGFGSSVS